MIRDDIYVVVVMLHNSRKIKVSVDFFSVFLCSKYAKDSSECLPLAGAAPSSEGQ